MPASIFLNVPTKNELICDFFSDGRVSEDTTNLIRQLLVLDSRKRFGAADVLLSLERTMNSW